MKVKCKKYLSSDGKELNSPHYLTKGKEYIVLGISFGKARRDLYIEADDGPGYADIKQFDITSNFIPSSWIIEYDERFDLLEYYPKSWVRNEKFCNKSFWERLIDEEPDIIKLYEKERDLIYKEEPK